MPADNVTKLSNRIPPPGPPAPLSDPYKPGLTERLMPWLFTVMMVGFLIAVMLVFVGLLLPILLIESRGAWLEALRVWGVAP